MCYTESMKRVIEICLCLLLLLPCSSAIAVEQAEETVLPTATPGRTPAPTVTPASPQVTPFTGLIAISASENATSEDVVRVQIRLRDLDYFTFKPTGIYQSMTANAAKKFQQKHTMDDGTPMIADGTIGAQSMEILFRHDVARADIAASIPIGSSREGNPVPAGELVSWEQVQAMLELNASYTITDYNTGETFSMVYVGGEHHAEMECADAFNAGIFREVFGGEYNYSKRPVVISIGDRSIAASLYGWPHGEDHYGGNEMDGHTCLFFDGSLSHVGGLPDAEHTEMIYQAAGRS